MSLAPLMFAADVNGGIMNLGFTKTEAKQDFKGKPDYITGQVMMVHRQEAPAL